MTGHRMLRSFALPVIQLWALKGAQSPLDENERWAPFETQISIGLCYTMQKQTTFLIQMSNSEVVLLHSQRTLFDHSFFSKDIIHSKLYNAVQLTSE